MIALTYFALALWPSVFAGKQTSFECQLHQPQQETVLGFSADVNLEGQLHSDVFQKLGRRGAMIGIPKKVGAPQDSEIIFTSGPSNMFTWLFGDRAHGYTFEMTDYPADKTAHFLLTEHGVSGGRHAFDRMSGFGTCKPKVGDGQGVKQ